MARRLVFAVAALGVCFVVVLAVWQPWRDTSPAGSARRACELMDAFRIDVVRNAASDRALRNLRAARSAARDAAHRDRRWIPLSSGVDAVQVAIDTDDAGAARTGMQVVASNCEIARRPFTTRTR